MRRNRRLTTSDQWDLGLLLALLIVLSLCLTVAWRSGALPRLFAFAFHSQTTALTTPASVPSVSSVRTPSPVAPPALSPQNSVLSTSPIPLPILDPFSSLSTQNSVLSTPSPHPKPAPDFKYYDGDKYRYLKTIRMRVTAYAPDRRCCYPYNGTTTASGESVRTNHGQLVATDTNLIPFHCLVSIPGYHSGKPVPTLDRGSAIKGHRIDVLLPTFSQAQDWGSQLLDVKIYVPVDN